MAKLLDKLYNRTIEGKLTIQEGDELEGLTPKYEVESVESLSSKQIDSLKAGDIVVKKTGNQKHAYIVSYKENGQGICLTYTDASCVETVSYDKSGDEWVFNSKDVMPLTNVEDAQSGTIKDFIGLNSSGDLVKETMGGLDLVVKTLEQTEANWSVTPTPSTSTSGITLTPVFNKIEVIGNILYIVMVNKIANAGESSINVNPSIEIVVSDVPTKYGEKIIDLDGNDLTNSSTAYIDYSTGGGGILPGVSYLTSRLFTYHNNANSIRVTQSLTNSTALAAGSEMLITSRTYLVLI